MMADDQAGDAPAADEQQPLDAAQLYQTLVILSGVRDASIQDTVQRILTTHGARSFQQVLQQFAPLFLAADEETQQLYARAVAGEGDGEAMARLFTKFQPLLSAVSVASSLFDADEAVPPSVGARSDAGAEDASAGAEGDTGEEGDEGAGTADVFKDAENDGQAYRAHELAYVGDLDSLRRYCTQFPSEMHMLDPRGNTPGHIAVLRHNLPVVRLLLEAGYDVNVKNSAGWTVIEDAVVQGHIGILRELLAASHEANMRLWAQKKPVVLEAMRRMPDFKMTMSWEFGSPVFSAIVKQLAPYDEYTIWKVGTKLRVDASIVGFEGMKWKRGNVSMRFNGERASEELCILNHDERKLFVKDAGMLSAHKDGDSLDAEIDFLTSSEIVQVNVQTANTSFEPVRLRLRDGYKSERIGAWETTVFAAASDLQIERKAKTGVVKALPDSFAEYLAQGAPGPAAPKKGGVFGRSKRQGGHADEEEVQTIKKKATGRANMVSGFPISTDELVALLEMVAPLNREIAKARSFLEEKVPAGLFPVKMRIPVAMSVHLTLAFPSCELITADDPDWWAIPPDYVRKSMKEQLELMGDRVEQLLLEEAEKEGGGAPGEGARTERVPLDGLLTTKPLGDDADGAAAAPAGAAAGGGAGGGGTADANASASASAAAAAADGAAGAKSRV